MKNLFILIFSLIFIGVNFAQTIIEDVSSETYGTYPRSTEILRGGQEKTATGTLKVLVIFVRYADDEVNTDNWPNFNVLPTWAQTFVDQSIPPNHIFTPFNASDFFDRSSGGNGNGNLGQFHVIGDVVYVTTLHNSSFYNYDFLVFNEIFQTLDDPNGQYNIDFKQYDNWEFMRNNVKFNHYYLPGVGDGIVDYIWIINRSASRDGVAAEKTLSSVNFNTNDGVTIKSTSGSRIFNVRDDTTPKTVNGPVHEYCHYLFGGNQFTGHFDGRSYWNHGNEGLIYSFAQMLAIDAGWMSGYEQYRLGWLNPTIIEQNTNVFILGDTHINNEAVIIPLRYDQTTGWLKEYYFIENFETRNEYNGANPFLIKSRFNHTFKHGLLVYHIKNENYDIATNGSLSIVNADGKFHWHLVEGANTPSDRSDDIIGKEYPTYHSEYDYHNYITINVGGIIYNDYCCLIHHNPTDPDGWRYTSDDWLGTERDFYNLYYNDVFTKYSNTAAFLGDDVTPTNVGFQVLDFDTQLKEYTLSIQMNSSGVLSLSPAKPQILSVTASSNYHPLVSWRTNLEIDMLPGGLYKIYRASSQNPSYFLIATVNHIPLQTLSYEDTDIDLPLPGEGCQSSIYYYYKVQAVDNTAQSSVKSDSVSIYACTHGGGITKRPSGETKESITDYKLFSNYPNPFNPTTTINFQLPKDNFVSLRVYNSLGQLVAELVNGNKVAGRYEVTFDASNLSSGVYFYVLRVGQDGTDFTKTEKMLLLK
jgi:hypothetical protein